MAERVKQLLGLLPASVRALPPAKLFVLLGIFGAVLAAGLVSVLWMSGGTKRQVLYTQLTLEDAAAITAKLREMHVPYTLEGDGTTILVPSTKVYDTRLRLATEGLPEGGGVGFELFDRRSFGMTEFMQKLNYQRALQGELARTITQLAVVQQARVHIVLPEKSLFIEQQEKPTASVMLKLAPGRRLTPDQIRGIAHLVGSSVEGLAPDDVTIVDTSGHILNQADEGTALLSRTEAQLTYQKTLEENLERRVQSLLERAVGKGKVMVRVSAALDFQHIERTEERFDADNPAIRSEQHTREQGNGPGFWAIGVAGVRSNVGTASQNSKPGKTASSLAKQSDTINYELSKMVSKVVAPSGEIKRLSVAVVVDGTYKLGKPGGEKVYVPRTAKELAKYRDLVKSAVGYNEARGDRVEVVNMPFEPQQNLDAIAMAQEAKRAYWLNLGRYGTYVILGILFFLVIGRPLVKWITAGDQHVPVEAELPRTVQELEADMGVSGMLPEAQEEPSPPERLKIGRPTGQELRTQLAEFVRSEPERAVEVLRVWLRG